jgi:GT2 family glycosyltransferase
MKLSVVIPTYHRPDALRICLEKLQPAQQSCAAGTYEIIVSDDGRKPCAKTVLANDFPHVRWIEGPQRGPAANRNAGAAAAQGEVIVFLDDDCLPQRDLLAAYARGFENPAIVAAEGRIRADREKRRMDEEAPVNEYGGCFWSCNIAIRRRFFQAIKGFDERFPCAAMEDVELRERIIRLSGPILFLPDALVIHPLRPLPRWSQYVYRIEAHAIYILIPGCHLPPPSYRGAAWNTLRILIRRFIPEFLKLRGRGSLKASRMLILPLLTTWQMKRSLRLGRKPSV